MATDPDLIELGVLGCLSEGPGDVSSIRDDLDRIIDDGASLPRSAVASAARRLARRSLATRQRDGRSDRYEITEDGRGELLQRLQAPEAQWTDSDSSFRVIATWILTCDPRSQRRVLLRRMSSIEQRLRRVDDDAAAHQIGGAHGARDLRRRRLQDEARWLERLIASSQRNQAVHRFDHGELPPTLLISTSGSAHVAGCKRIPNGEILDLWVQLRSADVQKCLQALSTRRLYRAHAIGGLGGGSVTVKTACKVCLPGVSGTRRASPPQSRP